jgi:transposase-like protein
MLCPSCNSQRVIKNGFARGRQRFRCLRCRSTFYDANTRREIALKKLRRTLETLEFEKEVEHWFEVKVIGNKQTQIMQT